MTRPDIQEALPVAYNHVEQVALADFKFVGPSQSHEILIEAAKKDALYQDVFEPLPDGQVERVTLARESGYCGGVQAAILGSMALAEKAAADGNQVHVNAQLTHGADSTQELKDMGVEMGVPVQLVPRGGIFSISAHGNPRDLAEARRQGIETYDQTCIFVHATHEAVRKTAEAVAEDGIKTGIIYLFLSGRPDHSEFKGTTSLVTDLGLDLATVSDEVDMERLFADNSPLASWERVRIVSQTTNDANRAEAMADELQLRIEAAFPNMDTTSFPYNRRNVCRTVSDRQAAVIEMVQAGINALVVVGSLHSNNTRELIDVAVQAVDAALRAGQPVRLNRIMMLNSHTQLPLDKYIRGHIGIVSGASTDQRNVDGVVQTLNPGSVDQVGQSDKDRLETPLFNVIHHKTDPRQMELNRLIRGKAEELGVIS